MRMLTVAAVMLAISAVGTPAAQKDKKSDGGKEIVIDIVGKGADAKYIREGDKEQKDVVVTVGQTVTWKNEKHKPHTATSKTKLGDKPLFRAELEEGDSKSIKFDEKLYKDAGGSGKDVTLEYFCEYHPSMKSRIILRPAGSKK